jgi:hypothetical protein
MRSSRYLIFAIFVCFLLFAAGCTGRTGTTVPVAAEPAPASLESLGLALSEIPQNFTLGESRVKNISEVGKVARDLGWQQGYVIRFTCPLNEECGSNEILQTITRYPEKNSAGIAELIEQQERSDSTMIFSNLSSPEFGSYSRAFSGTVNTSIIPESGDLNPLGSGSAGGTARQDFVEIIFSKGEILEVIRMTGPEADHTTLVSLAQKAYSKLH